jgi:hypothetical protein
VFKVPLADVAWLEVPRPLDDELRAGLDAFAGKPIGQGWSWFVQGTHRLSPADFQRLTAAAQ